MGSHVGIASAVHMEAVSGTRWLCGCCWPLAVVAALMAAYRAWVVVEVLMVERACIASWPKLVCR
jgi:hypothetical protein